MRVDEQFHAYRHGHELIASTIRLGREDQDTVDRLSDLAGPLFPGEEFAPYITAYPLPSGSAYVVARTWQDLDAPRAGCVRTRSALIAMDGWAREDFVAPLLQFLRERPSTSHSPSETAFLPYSLAVDAVRSPTYLELSEALFLEQRQPIVVFDAAETEVAASRILQSLWPGLRKRFALCTRAGSPRHVSSRPFDLLFAPSSARHNFGHWTGRRVDGSSSKYDARHRWTSEIHSRIFLAPHPRAIQGEASPLVDASVADESALRLSLLWEELLHNVETSPLAVLGLLDILQSKEQAARLVAAPEFEEILTRAVGLAARTYSTGNFLSFLLTFLGKFPQRLPATRLLRRIRHLVGVKATNVDESLSFLRKFPGRELQRVPAILAAGLGDGLAAEVRAGFVPVEAFEAAALLDLIAYSRRMAAALMSRVQDDDRPAAIQVLADALDTEESDLRSRARRHLIPHFQSPRATPILERLMLGANVGTLIGVVRLLWNANRLQVSEYDAVLVSVARRELDIIRLRESILDLGQSEDADRFLASTLELTPLDIDWLSQSDIPGDRKASLLTAVVNSSNDAALNRLGDAYADDVLELLALGEMTSDRALALARAIELSTPSGDSVLESLQSRFHFYLPRERQRMLATAALSSIFKKSVSDEVGKFLEPLDDLVPFSSEKDLVMWLTPSDVPTERVSRNLLVADAAYPDAKGRILRRIEALTQRLIERRGDIVGVQGVHAWAHLISESGVEDRNAQFRAASAALSYALDRKYAQVSELVVASFPIVYEGVARNLPNPPFLTFSFFDWDHCASLRSRLVDAYMNSNWPAHELASIAASVEQLEPVLDLVLMRYRGASYARNIVFSPSPLRADVKAALIAALEQRGVHLESGTR